MDNYAIYLRKSRADIELESVTNEDTLKRHKDILVEVAKKKGFNVVKSYEEVVSGESIADRPEMQRLLNDIYQKKYKGVLVVEVERLARGDTKDQGTVSDAFKYTDTLIITPSKIYDPRNEFDEEYFEFGLFMSRREYKTISRRMERGKISSVNEGNFINSMRPYGYDIVQPSRKVRTLAIRENEAEHVRMIYDWFINEKITAGEIARRLTRMGIPTYYGNREWHPGTINEMLKNPLYYGYIRYKYRPVIKAFDDDGNIIQKRARQNLDDCIIVPGKHDGIITKEQFDLAQRRFEEEPSRVAISSTMRNPFAGLVYCKECGLSMFYHAYKKTPGSKVRMTHRANQFCKVKSCFYYEFVDAVITILQGHIKDFEIKLQEVGDNTHIDKHEELIQAMEVEIKSINSRRASLFDLLERKVYSEEDFFERRAVLDQQKEAAMEELQRLIHTKPQPVNYQLQIMTYNLAIKYLKDEEMSPEDKNKFFKSFIKRIEYSRIDDDTFDLDIIMR